MCGDMNWESIRYTNEPVPDPNSLPSTSHELGPIETTPYVGDSDITTGVCACGRRFGGKGRTPHDVRKRHAAHVAAVGHQLHSVISTTYTDDAAGAQGDCACGAIAGGSGWSEDDVRRWHAAHVRIMNGGRG